MSSRNIRNKRAGLDVPKYSDSGWLAHQVCMTQA